MTVRLARQRRSLAGGSKRSAETWESKRSRHVVGGPRGDTPRAAGRRGDARGPGRTNREQRPALARGCSIGAGRGGGTGSLAAEGPTARRPRRVRTARGGRRRENQRLPPGHRLSRPSWVLGSVLLSCGEGSGEEALHVSLVAVEGATAAAVVAAGLSLPGGPKTSESLAKRPRRTEEMRREELPGHPKDSDL